MARIGLIGVGLLGSAIADRLVAHDVEVHGFDIDEAKRAILPHPTGTAQDLLDQCDVVILSLPTSEIVRTLIESSRLRANQTIIDTTTGEPAQMMAIGEHVHRQSARYVEATVAGSSKQMRTGDAVIFLGCESDLHNQITPIISMLSSKSFHLGEVGAASRFKLVHNLVLGLNRAVLAEGLLFGESLGFAPDTTLGILQQTPAASGVMNTKGPKMVERDFSTQARLTQHLKDVRLILAESARVGAKTPLSAAHRQLLEAAEQLGFGDADNSAVIEAFR